MLCSMLKSTIISIIQDINLFCIEFLNDRIGNIVVSRGASPRHDGEMHLLLHPFLIRLEFSLLSWNIYNSTRIYS